MKRSETPVLSTETLLDSTLNVKGHVELNLAFNYNRL